MNNIINIDAASFFQSDYGNLSWSIEDPDNGLSTAAFKDSVTDKVDIREAIKAHIINITNALPEKSDLIDYEISLSFSPDIGETQRKLFTEIFNEYNTRDERT